MKGCFFSAWECWLVQLRLYKWQCLVSTSANEYTQYLYIVARLPVPAMRSIGATTTTTPSTLGRGFRRRGQSKNFKDWQQLLQPQWPDHRQSQPLNKPVNRQDRLQCRHHHRSRRPKGAVLLTLSQRWHETGIGRRNGERYHDACVWLMVSPRAGATVDCCRYWFFLMLWDAVHAVLPEVNYIEWWRHAQK